MAARQAQPRGCKLCKKITPSTTWMASRFMMSGDMKSPIPRRSRQRSATSVSRLSLTKSGQWSGLNVSPRKRQRWALRPSKRPTISRSAIRMTSFQALHTSTISTPCPCPSSRLVRRRPKRPTRLPLQSPNLRKNLATTTSRRLHLRRERDLANSPAPVGAAPSA
ncbi:hypothetical protein [Apis mellifera associated microvirus 41]|nr:hypothetical protein [Apis mellifera associated microvirus 41]